MATCAELPQMGCCDEDLLPVGFYGVIVNGDFGAPVTPFDPDLAGLASVLRQKIADTPFPTTPNTADVYRWTYSGELEFVRSREYPADGSVIGTGGTSTGEVFQVIAGMRISKPVFSENRFVIEAGKALGVVRRSVIPACVGDVALIPGQNVPDSCLASRIVADSSLSLGSGFEYRVSVSRGEVEVLAPGISVRGQSFRYGSWVATGVVFGTIPSCCDLSALPP